MFPLVPECNTGELIFPELGENGTVREIYPVKISWVSSSHNLSPAFIFKLNPFSTNLIRVNGINARDYWQNNKRQCNKGGEGKSFCSPSVSRCMFGAVADSGVAGATFSAQMVSKAF
jgi:hypothetical protein